LKNILHISTSKGGVEYYINSIIDQSKAFSHFLAVDSSFESKNKTAFLYLNDTGIPVFKDVKNICTIIASINNSNIKINLLHGHSSKGVLYACITGYWCKIPVIASPHAYGFYRFKGIIKLFVAITEYLIYNLFGCYLLPSNKSERFIGEKRFFIKKNIINRNYFNSLKVTGFNRTINVQNNIDIIIVCIGRITYQKNPEKYFNIARQINKIIHNVTFLLVGGGFEDKLTRKEKKLRKLVKNELKIIDWVSEQELIDILTKADIYVSTSRYEGLPTATLLAMNYELPIVSTRTPGNEDLVIDGYNGFLSNDTNILVKKIIELIENKKLRLKFGKKSKTMLNKHYNLENNILMLEKNYHSYSK